MSSFRKINGIRRPAAFAAAMMLAAGTVMSMGAYAAGNTKTADEAVTELASEEGIVTLSTDYPGVSAQPGDTSKFSLYITNTGTAEADVTLSAENLPEGWEGYFSGDSGQVSKVHVGSMQLKADSPKLSYSMTVPEGTENGDYDITLKAESADGEIAAETTLTVTVNSEEKVVGASTFTTDYPDQEGASGTSFSYSTTLTNNGGDDATYALSASAPEGWRVSFTPSSGSSAVSSVPVAAGASETITVAINPADTVTAGDYEIDLTAASASETVELPLKVTVTGSYGLTLTTPSGNLSASAYVGEAKQVTLNLTNSGNIELSDISLTGTGSTDWEFAFNQDKIDTLAPGETAEITATITPAKDSIIGDYVAEITAKATQTSAVTDLRVSVQNHTTSGYIAAGVIVILIVALIVIIRKFGRR